MFCRLCGLAIAAGMLFGVDLASIGAALEGMAEELDLADGEDEWVVSGAKGGAVFGSLLGGALIVSKGRRFSMLMASLPFLIGPLLIITAVCFWQVFCGRLLMGFGFGLASVATPCYLSEVVLPAQRGCFEALYELGIATGMLLSSLLNLLLQALGGEDGRLAGLGTWRWQAGVVPCAFAVPLLILSPLVPESPRWLMQQGTQMSFLSSLKEMARLGRPGARERLHRVKTLRQEDLANIEDLHAEDLANIEDLDAEAEKLEDDLVSLWVEKHRMAGTPLYTASSGVGEQEDVQRQRTCRLLWRTFGDAKDILLGRIAGARQGLLLALAAAVLNQACASTSILIYAQKLLSDVGVRSQVEQDLQSCILIAAKLLGVTLGLVLVSRVTRRALLSVGGLGCSVSLTLLMVGVLVSSNVLLLTGMGLFVLFFFSTWGVGYWSVVVEVTAVGGPRYASCAQALATATLFGTGWLTSLTFLKVMSLGGYGLLVYVTVAVLMCVYALVWLPETSGHSLEECAHDVEVQAHVNLEDSCAVSTSDSESS